MTRNLDRQYRQSTSGLYRRTIAGVTALHRESWDAPLVLNPALQLVWTCLEIGGSVEDIADDIVNVFGNDAGEARSDVEDAFRQLHDLALIEPVDVG